MRFKSLVFSLILLTGFFAHSQFSITDLNLSENVEEWYTKEAYKNGDNFVIGKQVDLKIGSTVEHQYFKSRIWAPIRIRFRGTDYENLIALYDLQDDILIISFLANSGVYTPIKLEQSQIESFVIHNSKFTNYSKGLVNEVSGFFEEVFVGENVVLLVKRKKIQLNAQGVDFEPDDKYYFCLNDACKRFRSKQSILKELKSIKSEIKMELKSNNITQFKPQMSNDSNLKFLFSTIQTLLIDEG